MEEKSGIINPTVHEISLTSEHLLGSIKAGRRVKQRRVQDLVVAIGVARERLQYIDSEIRKYEDSLASG